MAQLITASDVITIAFSGEMNISSDRVTTYHIDIAEKRYVIPRIGKDLYDALAAGSYTELKDKIKPALAFYVKSIVLPEIKVLQTNMGIMQGQTDYAHPVGAEAYRMLISQTLTNADVIMDSVIDFLNESEYEEYIKTTNVKFGFIL